MSTSGQLPTDSPLPPAPQNDHTRELVQFLREENTANRGAVREDADATRKLLLDTVKFVSFPVGVLLLAAGFFGWRSFEDMKHTIESEAQRETKKEITQMRTEIEKRLTEQFQTPALQETIKEASKTIVVIAVNKEVGNLASRMDLLQRQIAETGDISNAGARLRLGFRPALDTLVEKTKSPNSYVSQYAKSTLSLIGLDYESTFSIGYGNPTPIVGAHAFLGSMPITLPLLMRIIKTDQHVNLVTAAFLVFREMTNSTIQTFDIPGAEKWCAEHRPKCE
jgi:hypothetical protein